MKKLLLVLGVMLLSYGAYANTMMTMKDVAKHNGLGGNPAYVVVDGDVYDVSQAEGWKEGMYHSMDGKVMLKAGSDISAEVAKFGKDKKQEMLAKLTKVGKLQK